MSQSNSPEKHRQDTNTETHTTELEVAIERLDEEDDRGNYRVTTGNPLTGNIEAEFYATSLKINDHAAATSGLEIGEHNEAITLEMRSGMINIILDKEDIFL